MNFLRVSILGLLMWLTSPVMAAVGVTDLAVERVRQAVAEAGHLQEGFEARVTKNERIKKVGE